MCNFGRVFDNTWPLIRGLRFDCTGLCPKLVLFIVYLSGWFPHRLEPEDYTRPWFCPKLVFFLLSSWFPHRLESEDHTRPWFCPKLVFFLLSSWFPHRLESKDHTRPWFCPKLVVFFFFLYLFIYFSKVSPSTKVGGVSLMLEAPRAARAIDTARSSS